MARIKKRADAESSPVRADVSASYVCGTAAEPLLYATIGQLLARAAGRWPERSALVVMHQGIRWTFGQLLEAADRLAAGLIALGLEPGERVGIWSPNTAEWVLTQFATARAGLILVNINPAYRQHELEYALRKVGCKALVFARSIRTTDCYAMLQELLPELAAAAPGALRAVRLPELRTLICVNEARPGTFSFDQVTARATPAGHEEIARRGARLDPDDPINIQFTSGTTGSPKGATLTHFNIVNNAREVGACLRLGTEDRLCIPVPLYHCFGMVMGVLACVCHGATMVLPSESFEAGAVLKTVAAERCTALYGVPTMFIAELDHPEFARFDLSSLRTGVMAGSPCPVEVMKRVLERMHMREVTICYGMTETSPVSFQTQLDDSVQRRVSTVGRIHPFVEAKVVDAEGRILPRGQSGELLVRGYSVMRGYWDDEARTREAIDPGGWMHTGDLATLDEQGYCNIVGRVKDMIIRGGENVYPREVEEFLFTHPAIQEVAVLGVPCTRYGEEVCAWVKLRPGQSLSDEDLKAFCRSRIAHFKVPRYVRFVESFPMTVTGKMQKFLMREEMKKELGLAEERTA